MMEEALAQDVSFSVKPSQRSPKGGCGSVSECAVTQAEARLVQESRGRMGRGGARRYNENLSPARSWGIVASAETASRGRG
jgi:hypothetical protein